MVGRWAVGVASGGRDGEGGGRRVVIDRIRRGRQVSAALTSTPSRLTCTHSFDQYILSFDQYILSFDQYTVSFDQYTLSFDLYTVSFDRFNRV